MISVGLSLPFSYPELSGASAGRLVEEYYYEAGRVSDSIELTPGGLVVALNIPAGQWHTVHSLESGTVILEVKDGPYAPQAEEDVMR